MTYKKTLDYLYAQLPMYHRLGAQAYKANLDNTIALCNLLGNPQNSFKTIHVTGTNGKGSVSHLLASILQTSGLRTGLYTSPHLKDFRERIRVNGKKIEQSYVSQFIEKYRDKTEQIKPSFFELTVGMAFDYFRNQKVDIAVIEVGLGGRLDSTNIINPLLSVITNISLDHTQFLGDTIEKIAAEKAGIIKPGIPVIIGETQVQTTKIFQKTAKRQKSDISFADQLFSIARHKLYGKYLNKQLIDINYDEKPYLENIVLPLAGQYQLKNIITVIAACEQLSFDELNFTEEIVRQGIANVIINTGLQGRWQILGTRPLTICDTGHNEGGLKEVLSQIAATPHRQLHFVFGVVNDKNLVPILPMLPKNTTYYFCKPDIPRGLDAHILQGQSVSAGLQGNAYNSVKEALKMAQQNAGAGDLVFVGGSTFVVAEVVK
ncbi:MAG: bifunctional folylpolyglutamate synthase/dihydrofolate synthase [Bacteroidetes bacterium]|nr:bifunctional folylpolyglutamate synthase/dihydrofolate synthase [Bacteroidota bacterium]